MTTRKLFSYMMVSVDGYHEDIDHALGWVNLTDDFDAYSVSQLDQVGGLVFGRRTYDGMVSYWTSPEAFAAAPEVASRMNAIAKTVVTNSPGAAAWANATAAAGDAVDVLTALKQRPGRDLAILGSSSLTSRLLTAGLVDELRVMMMPVLLGDGISLFDSLGTSVRLTLARVTAFGSGNVLLCYQPEPATARTDRA